MIARRARTRLSPFHASLLKSPKTATSSMGAAMAVSFEAASLREFHANDVEAVREFVAHQRAKRAEKKALQARNVADLLEYGYPHTPRASALLLDVLA
jgi:hypothetical protein